ncbi:MAG: Ig-like domain-containing protein, partial [Nocardioidaceae bacterium]
MVVVVLAAGLVAAWRAAGYDKPRFDLHDGGVWVSRSSLQQVGRLNTALRLIDARLTTALDFELYQSGRNVLVHDRTAGVLRPVDVRFASFGPEVKVGADASVSLGGTTAAVLRKGRVWVGRADQLGAMGLPDGPSALTVRGGAALAVGVDGIVHVLIRRSGQVVRLDPHGAVIDRRPLGARNLGADVQLTAVGDRSVVLDPAGQRLLFQGDRPVALGALSGPAAPGTSAGLAIQQPGPPNPEGVLVAGTAKLVAVRPGADSPEVVVDLAAQGGGAAAPVFVSGCAYGAWSGMSIVAVWCTTGSQAVTYPLGPIAGPLQFRVNRGQAVVNDLNSGVSWLLGKAEPKRVDDWSQALTSDEPDAGEGAGKESRRVAGAVKVYNRAAPNRPPAAVDDELATRPGRATVLHPLANDSDEDLDVLLLAPPKPLTETDGKLELIDGGAAFQFTPPAGRTDPVPFDYVVTDGRGGEDTGRVTMEIHPEGQNGPPKVAHDRVRVAAGSSVDHDVLANDTDPDGDALSLAGVALDPGKGTVQFRPDGLVTYTPAGGIKGDVTLTYQVVDEYGAADSGQLVAQVQDGNLAPLPREDHAVTFAGRDAVVELLANDSDPNRDTLSVVKVQERSDARVTWTPQGRLRFRAERPGSYDLLYTVSDGTNVADTLVRVEVLRSGDRHGPIAVRDEAMVRAGVATLVAPLANDVDLDGDVLVLQRVDSVPPPLVVELLQRQFLRVRAMQPLDHPLAFSYLVTDGGLQATGTVVVRPAPPSSVNQAPVTGPDEISVRAGNVTRVDVLANDIDPDGDTLQLAAVDGVPAEDGLVFIQGRELRYQAPTLEKGAVVTHYTVVDSAGNKAAGTVTIHVTPADPARNQPPQPRQMEARLFSGRTTEITVPLVGADPDGDPVVLLGLSEPPSLGEVVAVHPDSLVYHAFDDSVGTDRFTYRVRDPFGSEATGVVLVGIAPPPDVNSPPVAVPDTADVAPGADVRIPVLANDSDPDGDEVEIPRVDDAIGVPRQGKVELTHNRQAIIFHAPRQLGPVSFDYAITDGRGTIVRGLVTVTVAADAPKEPPVARDDVVKPQAPGATLVIDVLANDDDPDGDPRRLTVSVDASSGAKVRDGKVHLVMPDRAVSLVYTVTDADKLSARAFVMIGWAADLPPVAGLDKAETGRNQAVRVDVLANDKDREGAALHLIRVVTTKSGSADIEGDAVRFTPSADFVGDAAFTYEVSDEPDGEHGNMAVGTASISVTGNRPPRVTAAIVEVPAGGSRSIDLRSLATDPDGDHLSFGNLSGAPKGLRAAIDGSTLSVSADDTTPKDTS